MNKPYQEKDSTFTHEGKEHNLNKLFILSKDIKPIPINISDLIWIITDPLTNEDKKRIKSLIDPEVPILVTKYKDKLAVIDGYHRLLRSRDLNHKTIEGKIIPKEMLDKTLMQEPLYAKW